MTCLIRPLFLGSKGDLLIQVQLYFILFSNYNSNTNDLVNNECYSISGIIKAMADIDRETTPILYVSVKASDGVNSETAVIVVNIEDINDNPPSFTSTYR